MKEILFTLILIYLAFIGNAVANETYLSCQLMKIIDHKENKTTDFINDPLYKQLQTKLIFIYQIKQNKLKTVKASSSSRKVSGEIISKDIDVSKAITSKLYKKTDKELIFKNKDVTTIIDRFNFVMVDKSLNGEDHYKCAKIDALL